MLDRLLQVITDELVDLPQRLRPVALEPIGESLVQPRPIAPRHARIRGLADQHVAESDARIAPSDESPSFERSQMTVQERSRAVGDEKFQRVVGDVRPDDGGAPPMR